MENNIILYTTIDGRIKVELYEMNDNIWLPQRAIAELFDTSRANITMHIQNIIKDKELIENSVCKYFLHTAKDGKQYDTKFYSLEMILAVGFRVRSKRGVQFRIWANEHLKKYLQKGFLLDNDRLKNPNGRTDYFDELLEQIRDIRASEKRFYQKVRDLFALSIDYDSNDKAIQMFFANTQNKLLYAVTHKTASEIICERANENEPNMGLTSWKGNIVRKGDIVIAKNYLNKNELDSLNRIVNVFLESAELRVKENKTLTMDFWRENIDSLLEFQGKEILQGFGSISNEEMEKIVAEKYKKFNATRKKLEAIKEDENDIKEIEESYKILNKAKK